MLDAVKKVLHYKPADILESIIRRYSLPMYNRRITRLEKQYDDLINEPYKAKKLSEIVSELGKLWNEKLKYEGSEDDDCETSNCKTEECETKGRVDGAKNLQQVQEEVYKIVKDAGDKITSAKTRDKKQQAFKEGLKKMAAVLDEWR